MGENCDGTRDRKHGPNIVVYAWRAVLSEICDGTRERKHGPNVVVFFLFYPYP